MSMVGSARSVTVVLISLQEYCVRCSCRNDYRRKNYTALRVQILDESVCVGLRVNALKEGINESVLPFSYW